MRLLLFLILSWAFSIAALAQFPTAPSDSLDVTPGGGSSLINLASVIGTALIAVYGALLNRWNFLKGLNLGKIVGPLFAAISGIVAALVLGQVLDISFISDLAGGIITKYFPWAVSLWAIVTSLFKHRKT